MKIFICFFALILTSFAQANPGNCVDLTINHDQIAEVTLKMEYVFMCGGEISFEQQITSKPAMSSFVYPVLKPSGFECASYFPSVETKVMSFPGPWDLSFDENIECLNVEFKPK